MINKMLDNVENIYFLGIGGVGMSALAYWTHCNKIHTQGWDDNINTPIVTNLTKEGIVVHNDFQENQFFLDVKKYNRFNSIVIYTPAISTKHQVFQYFSSQKIRIYKRADLLEFISNNYKVIAVAGTHGKTTISIMLSHILKSSGIPCNAFFGGVAKNYKTNCLIGDSAIMVVEADEYDQSFLKLSPMISLISSLDKDHGDIYNNHNEMVSAYKKFINNTTKTIIGNYNLDLNFDYTYSMKENSDFYSSGCRFQDDRLNFKIHFPNSETIETYLLFGAKYNMENAIAAAGLAFLLGVSPIDIGKGLESFKGVDRRFEYHLNTNNRIIIDDYAHHPEELRALIKSVRLLYSNKEIFLIFQPHLFSRTKEFANEFSEVLSLVDKLILFDIYPARENPISGVTSKNLLKKISLDDKWFVSDTELYKNDNLFESILLTENPSLVITAGAGDIYKLIPKIKLLLT